MHSQTEFGNESLYIICDDAEGIMCASYLRVLICELDYVYQSDVPLGKVMPILKVY